MAEYQGKSRKIKDLRRDVEALLKYKFVKNVVQDLTSGGHEWMRAKWSAPIRKYWKISEQMINGRTSPIWREQLKQYYWKPYFWSDSYFVCSVSDRTESAVKSYIDSQ